MNCVLLTNLNAVFCAFAVLLAMAISRHLIAVQVLVVCMSISKNIHTVR